MMKKLEGDDLKQVEALLPLLKEERRQGAGDGRQDHRRQSRLGRQRPGRANNIATDIDCDECGKPMVIRNGRRGPFLGCSGYPKCKNTGEVPAKLMEEMGLNGNGTNGNGKTNGTPQPEVHHEETPAAEEE